MKRKSENGNVQAFQRRPTELVFDPQKRAEFLSGFHKRKMHRRKIAQGVMQRKLKAETKRIRTEAKENMKKLYHSYKPIPELMDPEEANEEQEEEYDTENVTVKVVELSTSDLAKENNWIGENRSQIRGREEETEEESDEEDEVDERQLGVVPGMELDGEKKVKTKRKSADDETSEGGPSSRSADKDEEKPKQRKGPVLNLEGIRSKKELKHKLKRYAMKSMKQSQAFRQKARLQQQKQLKKSRRVRHFKEKHLKQKKGFKRQTADGRGEGRRKRGGDD